MTTPSRPPGRPRDERLSDRFLDAGIRVLADQGLRRLNADVLCAKISAGKAGFYRRWSDVDVFLAAIARRQAVVPVVYPQPRTMRSDLAALVLHQVTADRALVAGVLLPLLRHSDVLLDMWVGADGPGGRLLAEVEQIVASRPVWGDRLLFLQRGVQRIVAGQRELVLVHGAPGDQQLVLDEVDDLLAAADRRTPWSTP